MTRTDKLHGTGSRTGAPTSRGPAVGSATGPDAETPARPFGGRIDGAATHRVTA